MVPGTTPTHKLDPSAEPRRAGLRLDLPAISRYLGHGLLLALVLLVSWAFIPRDLPEPALGGQLEVEAQAVEASAEPATAAPSDSAGLLSAYVGAATAAGGDTQYLTRRSEPNTLRAMRDVLTLTVPQRSVRTSVLVYRVQAGDSVLAIAQKFGLQGDSLLWANDRLADNPDFLQIDQELNILPVDGAYHTVAAGETIESIATRYKVLPAAIYEYAANGLQAPYTLTVGQKIIIPGGVKPYVPRRVEAYSGPVPQDARKGTGNFGWPMNGYVSQGYYSWHRAIDIANAKGTRIAAADAGYVVTVQVSDTGYGRMVVVDHQNGYKTLYAHLSVISVDLGQSVNKGDLIGLCGSTGNSTGPHLHFEIMRNDVRTNPFNYLP
ncbi:MAG: peptidoglycan DD-metalloendopeptidase family protein [Chloroflexi bacterium]|nr:peptidoglycan DD-metalloendopeptidase family protein [Chloroflexota bacterium]